MRLSLRQVCLVAPVLEPVVDDIRNVLGLEVCYRDPGVAMFGLENALFPLGNEFLEVVAPVRGDTAASRYLARRGGPGGYMIITLCDDPALRDAHIKQLGIEIAFSHPGGRVDVVQLHPRATGGTFFEIDWQPNGLMDPDLWGAAAPEGEKPDIASKRRTEVVTGIAGVELQGEQPEALATRWAEIAGEPITRDETGRLGFSLGAARFHFVPCTDGRPEGLAGVHLQVHDRERLLSSAEEHGLRNGAAHIELCGTRFYL